jgi:hypothetical protein
MPLFKINHPNQSLYHCLMGVIVLTKANFHLCQNNWLSQVHHPQEQFNLADTLGTVGQYLINQDLYQSGTIKAQWMSVPWIGIEWDQKGIVSEVQPLFPYYKTSRGITFDPYKHHSYIAVPNEISAALQYNSRPPQ